MNQKPAIASVTVWGAVLAGVSAAGSMAGVDVPIANDPTLALDISTMIGAGLAIYGRFRAVRGIGGLIRPK